MWQPAILRLRFPGETAENTNMHHWRESETLCALANEERHLGHVVQTGQRWMAFDGTHMNAENNGFLPLGAFATLAGAKAAVEFAAGGSSSLRMIA